MPVSLRHVGAEEKNDHSNSLDEVDRGEVRQLTQKAVAGLKWLPEQSKTTTLRHRLGRKLAVLYGWVAFSCGTRA